MAISLDEIRRRIVTALFSDDELFDQLVLKGGNALQLIHGISNRASVDIDFSLEGDFEDIQFAGSRIKSALEREFRNVDLIVIDFEIRAKPPELKDGQPQWWGGYLVNFKLCSREVFEQHGDDLQMLRRRSEVLGPNQKRTFKVDISKYEYCNGKERRELDSYTLYAYSLEMILLEKLRAICQQMEDYPHNNHRRPRPRDFFDIWQILQSEEEGIELASKESTELAKNIFNAKDVQMSLLKQIESTRAFHAADWPSVELSVQGHSEPFDYYFDFVVELVRDLQTGWEI